MTAPGTMPTAMNTTSSARSPAARARMPASRSAAAITPARAIAPQLTVRSPNSWAYGSKSKRMTAIGTVAMSVSKAGPPPGGRYVADMTRRSRRVWPRG